MDRKTRILIYGSPTFEYTPDIDADGHFTISPVHDSSQAKYLPFDYITILNNTNSNIKITVHDSIYYIEAGMTFEETVRPFTVLRIDELSGVDISDDKLKIVIKRKPMTADKKAQIEAENEFSPLGHLKNLPFIGRFI